MVWNSQSQSSAGIAHASSSAVTISPSFWLVVEPSRSRSAVGAPDVAGTTAAMRRHAVAHAGRVARIGARTGVAESPTSRGLFEPRRPQPADGLLQNHVTSRGRSRGLGRVQDADVEGFADRVRPGILARWHVSTSPTRLVPAGTGYEGRDEPGRGLVRDTPRGPLVAQRDAV